MPEAQLLKESWWTREAWVLSADEYSRFHSFSLDDTILGSVSLMWEMARSGIEFCILSGDVMKESYRNVIAPSGI